MHGNALSAVIRRIFAGSCLPCAGQAQGNRTPYRRASPYTLPQVTQTCGRGINRPTKVGIAPSRCDFSCYADSTRYDFASNVPNSRAAWYMATIFSTGVLACKL